MRLGRPQPRRPLSVRDLRAHFVVYGGSIAQFPYLFDMLEHELGGRVACTATTVEVTEVTEAAEAAGRSAAVVATNR